MIDQIKTRLRAWSADEIVSGFLSGSSWNLTSFMLDRGLALIQAFFVARILGVELFGKYGLFFSTVGVVSGLAGLQLGMAAAVHVARNRVVAPRVAASAMRACECVAIVAAIALVLLFAAHPERLSSLLFGSPLDAGIAWIGVWIAALSIFSGVQESTIQGCEEFRTLALCRAFSSVSSLVLLFSLSRGGDLESVLIASLVGVVLRIVVLTYTKEVIAKRNSFVTSAREIWEFSGEVIKVSVPSMMTAAAGISGWFGMLMLSRDDGGLKALGHVTAGLQWRGTLFSLTAVLASAAVPMMGRMIGQSDRAAAGRVHKLNLDINLWLGVCTVAVIALMAPEILKVYGSGFEAGFWTFTIIVATAVPTAYANVFLQYLISDGRMWDVLLWSLLQNALVVCGFLIAIPLYGAVGFAVSGLLAGMLFCLLIGSRLSRTIEARA